MGKFPPITNQQLELSIAVISFNTIDLTKACLDSVINNLGDLSAEIIVVDNASKDGSAQMIREDFPHVVLIENDRNVGFAAANNQAFSVAEGEFVLLLNSDTEIISDVLAKSIDYLKTNPLVGAMGCRVLNTDKTMQPTCSGYPTLQRLLKMTFGLDRFPLLLKFDDYLLRAWARDSEREVEVISGCYLMIRRSIIESVGSLDEAFFFFGEETDWCLRIRRAGWKLMFSPVGEIIHHGGGSVKKLNHRRDLMLTEATIRLHKKNSGSFSAALAFAILATFNVSRAAVWTMLSVFRSSSRTRARHFRAVAAGTFGTWPAEKTR